MLTIPFKETISEDQLEARAKIGTLGDCDGCYNTAMVRNALDGDDLNRTDVNSGSHRYIPEQSFTGKAILVV